VSEGEKGISTPVPSNKRERQLIDLAGKGEKKEGWRTASGFGDGGKPDVREKVIAALLSCQQKKRRALP